MSVGKEGRGKELHGGGGSWNIWNKNRCRGHVAALCTYLRLLPAVLLLHLQTLLLCLRGASCNGRLTFATSIIAAARLAETFFFKSIQITSNANLAGLPLPQVPASSQQKLPAKLPQPIDWLPPAIRCRGLLPATHCRILTTTRGNLVDKQAAIEHLGEITAVAPTSAIAAAQGVSSSNSGKEEIVCCSQLRHCCCGRCTVPQVECNKTTTDNQYLLQYYYMCACTHIYTQRPRQE